MDQLIAPALTLAVGFALGWSIAVLIARSRQQQLLLDAETRDRTSLQEQKNLLDEARQRLSENFKSMAADAIRDSSENLLALASERFSRLQQEASADLGTRQKNIEELIRPVRETLEKFD